MTRLSLTSLAAAVCASLLAARAVSAQELPAASDASTARLGLDSVASTDVYTATDEHAGSAVLDISAAWRVASRSDSLLAHPLTEPQTQLSVETVAGLRVTPDLTVRAGYYGYPSRRNRLRIARGLLDRLDTALALTDFGLQAPDFGPQASDGRVLRT